MFFPPDHDFFKSMLRIRSLAPSTNTSGIHIVRQHHLVWVDRHVKFTGDAVFGGIHYADGAASEVGDIQFVIFRIVFHRVSSGSCVHIAKLFTVA